MFNMYMYQDLKKEVKELEESLNKLQLLKTKKRPLTISDICDDEKKVRKIKFTYNAVIAINLSCR